jgi:hypothetical protein
VDEDEDNNYDEEFYDEEFDAQDGDNIPLQNSPSRIVTTQDVESSVHPVVDQPETKSEKSATSESPERLLSQPASELTKKTAQEDIDAVETQKTPVKGPDTVEGEQQQKDDEDNYGYDDFDDFED